jgi:sulfite oxidase
MEGVYDVTDFVSKHPGGEKILLGAGKAVDPFWKLYGQHVSLPHISHMLESMRIGNIDESEWKASAIANQVVHDDDPYRIDKSIQRHPGLDFVSNQPANAETPSSLLTDSFLTPNELFFVRHHFPVPEIQDGEMIELTANGQDEKSGTIMLTASQLGDPNMFRQHRVVATIQCTGNRRTGFKSVSSTFGDVKGLPWKVGAISNAQWEGPLLRDVIGHLYGGDLKKIPKNFKHVCFTGRDTDGSGQYYGISIPLDRALDERSDVILALKMNGELIPLDHGAPVRLIVPGAAGCRSVKWVSKIELSPTESTAFWQKEDYKSFSPSQGWKGIDFESAPSVMSTPVQSAITDVQIHHDGAQGYAVVKGYAFSGGGNAIIRVDVSADGGSTWNTANLDGENEDVGNGRLPYRRTYSWTLWEAVIDLPSTTTGDSKHEFVVKAVDESYNSQPEKPDGIWNVRGILNNSWHRVMVDAK